MLSCNAFYITIFNSNLLNNGIIFLIELTKVKKTIYIK